MQYLGSKNRIAKTLLPLILRGRKPDQYYVEPFVGGLNMIDKVEGLRMGSDVNYYLIEMWKALQNGWIPPQNISEAEYKYLKDNKDLEDPALVAFAGFLCSFAGKWFGGYARNSKKFNYAAIGHRSLMNQLPKVLNVELFNLAYIDLKIPDNSIIYCDPPYRGTTGYKDIIDHDHFFEWARLKAREGHTVYISEYEAPADFLKVFEMKHYTKVDSNKELRIEKLFTYNEFF